MHPILAGFYPFILGSPARCAFLSYLCLCICLGSPARSQLSRSAVALTVAATWEGSSMTGERVAVNEDGGMFSLFESVSEAMTHFVGFEKTLGILKVLFRFPGVF